MISSTRHFRVCTYEKTRDAGSDGCLTILRMRTDAALSFRSPQPEASAQQTGATWMIVLVVSCVYLCCSLVLSRPRNKFSTLSLERVRSVDAADFTSVFDGSKFSKSLFVELLCLTAVQASQSALAVIIHMRSNYIQFYTIRNFH